jgi:acyl-CoA thioesterase
MARAGGFAVSAVSTADAAGARGRNRLSVIQGGAEPPRWTATTLKRLARALDLRPTGFRRYEAAAPESHWPAFPGALLMASAVVAAERSFPGVSVGHMSCSFGWTPRANRPIEVVVSEVHVGKSCTTGRLTFRQGATVHGEATVLLRSCTGATPARPPRPARPRPAATRPRVPARGSSAGNRLPVAIVPWALSRVPVADDTGPTDDCLVWSRVPGISSDGTLQRALLAYLSELLPSAAAGPARYPGQPGEPGPSATVLSHAITYCAPFDLRNWLLATVQSAEPGEGYVHALATFSTRQGETVATVSQAVAMSHPTPQQQQRSAFRCPVQHIPASIRYGSQ